MEDIMASNRSIEEQVEDLCKKQLGKIKYYTKTELLNELTQYNPFVNKSEQALKSESFLKPVNWFNVLCGKNFQNLDIAIKNAKNNHGVTSQKRMDKVKSSSDCDVSYSDMYKLFEINKPLQKPKK